MAATYPKVSCVMVTADRHDLCRRAIWSYQQQTWPNRELVVLDNGKIPMDSLLIDVPSREVRYQYIEKTPELVIGALRNHALDLATGDYLAPQWDDDDWSHPDRLTRQMTRLLEGRYDACTLAGTLMHVDDPLYFDHPFIGLLDGGVPPTIVHRRDETIRFPPLPRTSDTFYKEAWRQRRYVQLPRSEAHLYIRYFHGHNIWEQEHFLRRMRNTPLDALAYVWHQYVRGNLFGHPRFQLSAEAQAGFQQYLEDSFRFDLFRNRPARPQA
jgi:glycosyltransferase involved in cell wall biosynthesis